MRKEKKRKHWDGFSFLLGQILRLQLESNLKKPTKSLPFSDFVSFGGGEGVLRNEERDQHTQTDVYFQGYFYFLSLGSRVASPELFTCKQLSRGSSVALVLRLCHVAVLLQREANHQELLRQTLSLALESCCVSSPGLSKQKSRIPSELLTFPTCKPCCSPETLLLSKPHTLPFLVTREVRFGAYRITTVSCPGEGLGNGTAPMATHQNVSQQCCLFYQHVVLPRDPKTTQATLTKAYCIHRQKFVLLIQSCGSIRRANTFFHTIRRCPNLLCALLFQ